MESIVFKNRRDYLRSRLDGGAILLMGLDDAPRNYPRNPYPFRQDSHFLYHTGTSLPGLALLIDPEGKATLFGERENPDNLIWSGPHPNLGDHAALAGIETTGVLDDLGPLLATLRQGGVEIHYLPPYRGDNILSLAQLLGIPVETVVHRASQTLAREVVEQRAVKTPGEVAQIEKALGVSAKMYDMALSIAKPGMLESEIAGAMQGIALAHDMPQSFLPIVTIRGEILHNNTYQNELKDGDLLLIDSGVEAPPYYYCSDITRTFPVSGTFEPRQKTVYQAVLTAQQKVIDTASPKVSNQDLHLLAAGVLADALKELGLMKGNMESAVECGAHALFYPHGIGHMLGIDVHDMEDLGDVVGYPEGKKRSGQFGLAFLRLAKKLRPGFVITVEPGLYFIPALIDRWKAEGRHKEFINYQEVEKYKDFGGVRIEDDVLITEDGCRVLGPGIPKSIQEIEDRMKK